jgi:hypothetical protein
MVDFVLKAVAGIATTFTDVLVAAVVAFIVVAVFCSNRCCYCSSFAVDVVVVGVATFAVIVDVGVIASITIVDIVSVLIVVAVVISSLASVVDVVIATVIIAVFIFLLIAVPAVIAMASNQLLLITLSCVAPHTPPLSFN